MLWVTETPKGQLRSCSVSAFHWRCRSQNIRNYHGFYQLVSPVAFKGERGQIATRTTFLLTAPLFFTFLTSNFPTLFVLLNFILSSGSFLKIPSGKRKISEKLPKTPQLLASSQFSQSCWNLVHRFYIPKRKISCYRIFSFALEVEIWTKNLQKRCFTLPGRLWRRNTFFAGRN